MSGWVHLVGIIAYRESNGSLDASSITHFFAALVSLRIGCGHRSVLLRVYPNNPAARKAMRAQAKWRKARECSGFLSQRTRIRRKQFIQECMRSTTQRRAFWPAAVLIAYTSSPRDRTTERPTGTRILKALALAQITLTHVETKTRTCWHLTPLSPLHEQ